MEANKRAYLKHRRKWRNALESQQVYMVRSRIAKKNGSVVWPAIMRIMAKLKAWSARRHRVLMTEYKPKAKET